MMVPVFRGSLFFALVIGVASFAGGCKTKDGSQFLSPDRGRPQLHASAAGLQAGTSPSVRTNVAPVAPVAPVAHAGTEFRTASSAGAQAPYRLRQGDPVLIYLRGIMPQEADVQDVVDEKGYVTLPYIDDVMALGKTASELEGDIQRIYIERGIYRTVTVNVILPSQSFFVQGEVKAPQRYALITGMTVMQAIAAAGGYTDFAEPKRVTVTRGSAIRKLNMREIEKNPKLDIMIESGDVIRVPRSFF